VSKRPLFSSYSQGENRVTGSILAVFERLDLSTLEQILRGATEESSIELMRFDLVKPEGPGTVPDASIAASFKYLFEVKTEYDSLKRRKQLDGHLSHLAQGTFSDRRLFVLTPDANQPALIADVNDENIRWFNFSDLNRAIEAAVQGEDVPADERVLLRELQILFAQEGLLGRQDIVVVAARHAYNFYRRWDAYVCQAGRAFRPEIKRLGFYRNGRIEPEFPAILLRRDQVVFSADHASELRKTGAPLDDRLASLIEGTLDTGSHVASHPYQVFLLSAADDASSTLALKEPIIHAGAGRGTAWTMGQRYIYSERLMSEPATTTELDGTTSTASVDELA